MFTFEITSGVLIAFAAALLALAFDYFPWLWQWYDAKDTSVKKQIMAGLLIGLAALAFAGTCLGWFASNLVCEPKTLAGIVYELLIAVSVNQGLHFASKPSSALKTRMNFMDAPAKTAKRR